MSEVETCPICLEDMTEGNTVLCMPVCHHKIHTKCALANARYDVRCPICRVKHPEFVTKEDDNSTLFANIENVAREYDIMIRRYNQKRSRAFTRHPSLSHLRDKLKADRLTLKQKDKEITQEWMSFQKYHWNNDPHISQLKRERRNLMQKTNRCCQKLETQMEELVGPRPQQFYLTLPNP